MSYYEGEKQDSVKSVEATECLQKTCFRWQNEDLDGAEPQDEILPRRRERLPGAGPRIQNRNSSLEVEVGPEPKQPAETNRGLEAKPTLLQPRDERKPNLITLGPATFPAASCLSVLPVA